MPTTCLLTAREKFLDSHLTSFSLLLEGIKKVSYCMRSRMKVKEEFKKLVDIFFIFVVEKKKPVY